eukprot:7831936-Pyramimonas_sp.AAC.1
MRIPHRLLFATIDTPGWPELLAGRACTRVSEGLSKRKLNVLKHAGSTLEGGPHIGVRGCLELLGG